MQSLRKRFNGNSQEVIDYARTWGISKAMSKYQVRDYVAFSGFLEEQTGNKNFAISPILGGVNSKDWAGDLLEAFVSKISKMEAESQSLKEELRQLHVELEYYKGSQAIRIEPKIQQVLAKCQA